MANDTATKRSTPSTTALAGGALLVVLGQLALPTLHFDGTPVFRWETVFRSSWAEGFHVGPTAGNAQHVAYDLAHFYERPGALLLTAVVLGAAGLAIFRRAPGLLPAAAAWLATIGLVGVYMAGTYRQRYLVAVDPGLGLYVSALGAALLTLAPFLDRSEANAPPEGRPYDLRTRAEQTALRAEWPLRMDERIAALNLVGEFTLEGRTWVELDEDEKVIEKGSPAE